MSFGGSFVARLAAVAAATAPVPPGDVTAPTLVSAVINAAGDKLTLAYNKSLDTGSVPLAAAFSLAGTSAVVTAVQVTGFFVVLTLALPTFAGETITVNYAKGAAPIQDLAGNDAANLVGQAVTNNSLDVKSIASADMGPFSTTDYYATAAGANSEYDFAPSTTWEFIIDQRTITSFQIPVCYCDVSHGWALRLSSVGASLLFQGGTGITVSYTPTIGVHHIVITRTAAGAVYGSIDGRDAVLHSSTPTYVAGGASSRLAIGYNIAGGVNPCVGTHVLHVLKVNAETSVADLKAISGQVASPTDRYSPHPLMSGHVSLRSWISVVRDHVQANATLVAGAGSNPWTLTKAGAGAVKNTIKAERRHVLTPDEIHDGRRFDVSTGGYIRHGVGSQVKVSGSVTKLLFDIYSNNKDRAGVFVDGVAGTNTNTANDGWQLPLYGTGGTGAGLCVVKCPGIDGSAHSVRAVDDWQALSGDPTFTAVQAVRWPADEALTITPYTPPVKRLHIETDSLLQAVDENSSVSGAVFSAIALLRANLAPLSWEVSADGYGSRQLNFGESAAAPDNNISTAAGRTALAVAIVRNCDGTVLNKVLVCLGTNDYSPGNLSKAAWKANAELTADRIKAEADARGVPGFQLYWFTPTPRANETNNNTGGSNLPDYRAAIVEIATARSSWMTAIDGPTMVPATPAGNYGPVVPLHLNKVGHALGATNIQGAMGM